MMSVHLHERAAYWRAQASALEPYAEIVARALRTCAAELESDARESSSELMSLSEASRRSGYHPDSLGRMIKRGALQNAGTRTRPKIRASDLPKKPGSGRRTDGGESGSTSSLGSEIARAALTARL
jgi:hypothetical protein